MAKKAKLHKADGEIVDIEVNTLKELARALNSDWVRPCYGDNGEVYCVDEDAAFKGKPVNIGELSQSGTIQGVPMHGHIAVMTEDDFNALPYDEA